MLAESPRGQFFSPCAGVFVVVKWLRQLLVLMHLVVVGILESTWWTSLKPASWDGFLG